MSEVLMIGSAFALGLLAGIAAAVCIPPLLDRRETFASHSDPEAVENLIGLRDGGPVRSRLSLFQIEDGLARYTANGGVELTGKGHAVLRKAKRRAA